MYRIFNLQSEDLEDYFLSFLFHMVGICWLFWGVEFVLILHAPLKI